MSFHEIVHAIAPQRVEILYYMPYYNTERVAAAVFRTHSLNPPCATVE